MQNLVYIADYILIILVYNEHVLKIIGFQTNRSEQTVETKTRLFIEEQSDHDLPCVPFHLHVLHRFLFGKIMG